MIEIFCSLKEIQDDKKREWDDFEEKEKKWMDKFASLQKEETQLVAERKVISSQIKIIIRIILLNITQISEKINSLHIRCSKKSLK